MIADIFNDGFGSQQDILSIVASCHIEVPPINEAALKYKLKKAAAILNANEQTGLNDFPSQGYW